MRYSDNLLDNDGDLGHYVGDDIHDDDGDNNIHDDDINLTPEGKKQIWSSYCSQFSTQNSDMRTAAFRHNLLMSFGSRGHMYLFSPSQDYYIKGNYFRLLTFLIFVHTKADEYERKITWRP